ncbi:MAG: hypothetical protein V4456_17750 [Bacteroidota bacterium]
MKTLKPIFKTFTLILLLAFAGCKKDGAVKPEPVDNTPITSAELLDYNIAISLSSELGLRIIYFNKDGNDIKATFDAVSFRRIFTVNVVNNVWTLDLNGNGSTIYTFTFARGDNGRIGMIDASYKKQDDASVKMQLVMTKNAEIPTFANKFFKEALTPPLYLKFSNDHDFAISDKNDYAGAAWSSYYDLCPGAWKGTYNGVNCMGFTLIQDDRVQMLLQKAGEANYHVFEPK